MTVYNGLDSADIAAIFTIKYEETDSTLNRK